MYALRMVRTLPPENEVSHPNVLHSSAVVSSIQTRQFLLPTLFDLLHVARLITLIDLVNITIAGILSHSKRLSDAIIFE